MATASRSTDTRGQRRAGNGSTLKEWPVNVCENGSDVSRSTLAASTDGIKDADERAGGLRLPVKSRTGGGGGGRHRRRDGAAKRLRTWTRSSGSRCRASFTEEAGHGEALTGAATVPVERPPLMSAGCRDVPAEHGGQGVEFSFGLEFSENFPGCLPYRKLRRRRYGRLTDA